MTFSFFFSHHITTMEGGMLCTNNKDLKHQSKIMRAHGWSRAIQEDSLEDFIYGAELSRNPDKVVQGHADILAAEIEKLKAVTKTSRFDEMSAKEKMQFMKRIRQMQRRLLRMRFPNAKKANSLDDIYAWDDWIGEL